MANYMHAAFYALIFSLLTLGSNQAQIYRAGDIYPYFGTNGKVSVFEEEGIAYARAVQYLFDDQDRLTAAVLCTEFQGLDSSRYILIYRFLSNGQRDSTWANNGVLRYELPGAPYSNHHLYLARQSDYKLLVSYNFIETSFPFVAWHIVRFSQSGQLDSVFGDQGRIEVHSTPPNILTMIQQMTVANNRIFVTDIGGHTLANPINGDNTAQTTIWAFHEQDGSLDSLWGYEQGLTYITGTDLVWGTTSSPSPFALSDNRLLVTGRFRMFCFLPDGQRDSSFGTLGTGALVTQLHNNLSAPITYGHDQTVRFAEQNNGQILVYGRVTQSGFSGSGFTMERMQPNGQLDSSFGQNGLVAGIGQGLGRRFSLGGMILDSAQRIIISYSAQNNDTTTTNPHVTLRSWDVVERYLPSGQLDSSFGQNGRVFVNFHDNDSLSQAFQLFMRQDGLILFTSASIIYSQAIQGRPQVSLDFTCLLSEPWVDSTGITDSTGLSLASLAVKQSLRVFPNPVLGSDLQLSYHLPQASKINYLLYDMQGRLVQYQNRGLVAEGEQQETLPLAPSLSPGQYILEMRVDGARTQVQIQKL